MQTQLFRKVFSIQFLLIFLVSTFVYQTPVSSETAEQWMPDPNLRHAVREELGLSGDVLLTQLKIKRLRGLTAEDRQITNLTGLEHAINLISLNLGVNGVRDLSPLAGLLTLENLAIFVNPLSDISPLANLVNLKALDLGGCQISDIRPLANLRNLESLRLHYNQIEDITSLANLTRLNELWLTSNRIVDISPLENLTALEELGIQNNSITDYSPLDALSLTHFEHDEICELSGFPIQERIQNRSFPSVFQAWNDILNRPRLSYENRLTHHDLFWSPEFGLHFQTINNGIQLTGNLSEAKRQRDVLLEMNPNMIFILELRMRDADPDSPFYKAVYDDGFSWIRDEVGNRVEGWPRSFLLDFTHRGQQDIIVQQALAVAQCGLYDGIFFDWWNEDYPVLSADYPGYEAEQRARDTIIQRIRAGVGDDFLIIVNTNRRKIPRTGWAINGTFMETGQDYDRGYTHDGLAEIESTLFWAEEHFREPRVNCLEGWGIKDEPPDSPANRRWMRVFTTMSLTHSDGYVLYNDGIQHEHYWYDFWDADLGQSIEKKAQRYNNREGLFIREFTNGWAVYNRSGKAQSIQLPEMATGVASGIRKTAHTLLDLDGEIYLKTVVQVAPGKHPPLYWVAAKTGTLHRLVGDRAENFVPEIQNATSLAVDAAAGRLYWTEKTDNRTGKIQSSNLDGTNVQLVKDLTSTPLDSALDATAGKLYLSNTWGKIQRMNLDGSDFQPNLVTGLKTPQNLVLDTASGKLYWTEQTSKTTGKVQRANLDGSNVQLVKALTSAPRGMAIDNTNKKLYVTNAWGKLQRMNLDGSGFQPNFITGLASPGQVAVDVIGDKVYWTEQGKLRRADLEGGNIQDVVIGLGELTDIALGIDFAGQIGVAAAPVTQTVVEQTSLHTNYPNPFNPETWIPYHLANDTHVEIHIYDTRGGLVRSLELGHQAAGIYTSRGRAAYWDGRNDVGERVASGIYFYQLQADRLSYLRKMVILK